MNDSIRVALGACLEAGRAILDIYSREDIGVEFKDDKSPLTQADRAAHEILMRHLEATGIPVLSEEGKHLPFESRQKWEAVDCGSGGWHRVHQTKRGVHSQRRVGAGGGWCGVGAGVRPCLCGTCG